jgi:hypothetical protein
VTLCKSFNTFYICRTIDTIENTFFILQDIESENEKNTTTKFSHLVLHCLFSAFSKIAHELNARDKIRRRHWHADSIY